MQDARQIAGELQVHAFRILAGHDLDLRDHGADQVHGFAAELGVSQELLQVRHPAPIELGEVRVDHDGLWRLNGFLGLLQRLALGFQLPHPIVDAGRIEALLHGLHDRLDLALDRLQLALPVRVPAASRGCQAIDLLLVGARELGDQIGCDQLLLQGRQDAALDVRAGYPSAIGAVAHAAMPTAAIHILADDRVGAATAAAGQQTGEQELAAMGAIERVAAFVTGDLEADLVLPLLDLLPQRILDDPQVRYVYVFVLGLGIDSRQALAGARVLDVRAAVPGDPAGIERVVEDAGAALLLAADSGVLPRTSAGTLATLSIELLGNRAGAHAAGEQPENAPDDLGFGIVDAPGATAARITRHHVVAVSLAASDPALEHTAELAALGLVAQVGEENLRHGAEQADMHRGHGADIDGMKAKPQELQFVEHGGDVRQTAGEAVQSFDQQHLELPLARGGEQSQEAWSVTITAGDRLVVEHDNNLEPVLGRIAAADLDLVVDRGFALVLGRIAGVDSSAHGLVSFGRAE